MAGRLDGPVFVVKSQIHAGGRGKGTFQEPDAGDKGGVRVVKSAAEVEDNARQMLGSTLVTVQTGPDGKQVKRVYIEDGCDIRRELYLSMLVDRATSSVVIVASTEGGMDIEEVAALHAGKDPVDRHRPGHRPPCRSMPARSPSASVWKAPRSRPASSWSPPCTRPSSSSTARLLEINPLVVTGDGKVIPLDCKMNFDDNALFRHPDIEELRDEDEEDRGRARSDQVLAELHQARRVNIGCMVNGAGLAMATMDIIKLYGGSSRPTSSTSAAGRRRSASPRPSS